ncbi:MAG TPA: hypothetical protein DIS93_14175 [Bdellovibrionales bacterium]|nr:hypothetical protein [Bdellovibrionales bacterium]
MLLRLFLYTGVKHQMNFLPVRIGTLRPGDIVNFNIFILIADKYVHYIRTSDPFEPERIERLRAKGVKKLYIPDDSESAYLAYLDTGLSQLKNDQISVQERSSLVSSAMVTESENALHNMQTESGYKKTEERVSKVVDFLTSESGALKNILASTGTALDNYQHSANVTSMALGIAARLGVSQTRDIMDLGIAGLLHDSALTKMGFAADFKWDKLAGEDLKKYHEHPVASAHQLAGKPYINREILELIANHEEIGEGAGFPGKKRLSTMPLKQQVLNLCNNFEHYCSAKGLLPLDAAKSFLNEKIGLFDLEHIKILTSVLK